MSEYSPDLHVKIRRFARLHGKGCSRQCPCKWCRENRTFKNKRQAPIDDYGRILK